MASQKKQWKLTDAEKKHLAKHFPGGEYKTWSGKVAKKPCGTAKPTKRYKR